MIELLNIDCMEKRPSKLKGRKRDPESVRKGAEKKKRGGYFYCIECGERFWRQPSAIIKGQNKFCSKKCYQTWQKGKTKISGFVLKPLIGESNPNWQGGKTAASIIIRNSNKYKDWRKKIFERDRYTCKICGARSKKGHAVYLEAHHIKSFALYPELRFDIDNGITLCRECHEKTKIKKNGKYRAD